MLINLSKLSSHIIIAYVLDRYMFVYFRIYAFIFRIFPFNCIFQKEPQYFRPKVEHKTFDLQFS